MARLFERWLVICIAIMCLIFCCQISTIHAQRTFLDKFISDYRRFRIGLFKFVGRSDTDAAYLWSFKRQVFNELITIYKVLWMVKWWLLGPLILHFAVKSYFLKLANLFHWLLLSYNSTLFVIIYIMFHHHTVIIAVLNPWITQFTLQSH